MAKRFTDNMKWEKMWFRKLSPKLKCFWFFICERCDNAGVWETDFELASYFIGESVIQDEILRAFNCDDKERLKILNDGSIQIIDYVDFQIGNINGEKLTNLQKNCISLIEKHKTKGYFTTGSLPISYPNPTNIGKGKGNIIKQDVCQNAINQPKEKYDVKTPLQKVIVGWKIVVGVAPDDRSWDKLNWARTSRTAKDLLEFFSDDVDMVINCMEDNYNFLKKSGLECTIETIKKRAWEWREKNGKIKQSTGI